MSYNNLSKLDFNNLISSRLGDLGKVYWSSIEIDLLIKEALCTFGCISQFWKHRLFLTTQIDKNDYDLYNDLDLGSLSYITKANYNDIIDLINIQLIEDISTANPVSSSSLYNLDSVNIYIDKRIDTFLAQTGLNISIIDIPIQQGIYTYQLPNNLLDIIRISFRNDEDVYHVLTKEDEGDLNSFDFDYLQTQANPEYYTRVLDSDNLIRLYPIPANNGTLQVIGIVSRDKTQGISIEDNRVIEKILLPHDLYVYIKWGVLEDLLRQDGIGQDLFRAKYCSDRWNEGLIIGKAYTSILNAYVNELSLNLDSLTDIDDFNPDWQNDIQSLDDDSVPTENIDSLVLLGYNLFFTSIIPKSINSLALDCVVNAPINSGYIELREEYINVLLDYIIHLASFKEGYARIQSTSNLLSNFLSITVKHNNRLMNQGKTIEYLLKKTKVQEEQSSRGVELVTTNQNSDE